MKTLFLAKKKTTWAIKNWVFAIPFIFGNLLCSASILPFGSCFTEEKISLPIPVATASNNGPVCEGHILTLMGGPNGMVSYLWTGPNGFTSADQNPIVSLSATPDLAGTYTLIVNDGTGNSLPASTLVTVISSTIIVGTIGESQTICSGSLPATLFSTSLPSGGSGAYTFQWQTCLPGAPWSNIPGAIGQSFDPGVLTTTKIFRKEVTDIVCGNIGYTNEVTITVIPVPPPPIVTVVNQVGSSILTASGVIGSLLWSTGATTGSITVASAGIYAVIQTNGICTSSPGIGIAAPISIPTVPSVNTISVSNITSSSAICGGNVIFEGGATVTTRGVCWSTSPNPDITGSHTINGSGSGLFSSNLSGLTPNTVYYIRAYATNSFGTSYGNEVSFFTLPVSPPPSNIITIGTGTVTMTYPFHTYYHDGRTQILYSADAITNAGGVPGQISQIGFNISTYSSQIMNGFNIRLQNTNLSSLSNYITAGWTTVYSGTYAVPGTGWQMISLQTPFYWDGRNLLLEVCFDNNEYTSFSFVYSTANPGSQIYYRTDGQSGCSLTAKTDGYYSPNLRLNMGSAPCGNVTCEIESIPGVGPATNAPETTIFLGYGPQSVTLNSTITGSGNHSYSWSPSTGLNCTTCQNPVFTPTSEGIYEFTLTVTEANGCTTTCFMELCVLDIRVPGTNGNKVYLCHVPPGNPNNSQTLSVNVNAVPAHVPGHPLDHLGKCDQSCGNQSAKPTTGEMITSGSGSFTSIAYPNPFTSSFELTIESESPVLATLEIYSITGKVLRTVRDVSPNIPVGLGQDLDAGIYLMVVRQDEEVQKIKVVKTD